MTFLEIAKEKFSKSTFGDLMFPVFIIFVMFFLLFSPVFNTTSCDSYCEQKKILDLKDKELQIKERQIRMENIK